MTHNTIILYKNVASSKILVNYLYNFQIHPGALKQGGIPLVACCISAAKQASVSGLILFEFNGGLQKTKTQSYLSLWKLGTRFDNKVKLGNEINEF